MAKKFSKIDDNLCEFIAGNFIFFFKEGAFHIKAKESFSFKNWVKFFSDKETAVKELKEMLKGVKDAYQMLV